MRKVVVVGIACLIAGLLVGWYSGRYALERYWTQPLVLKRLAAADVERSSGDGADPVPSIGTSVLRPAPLALARKALAEMVRQDPLVMTIGNHDARLSSKLSAAVPEFEGVPGFDLRSHIGADWAMAWQIEINGSGPDSVLVNHRHRSGASATKANALAAGRANVTGHTHQPGITRLSHGARHLYGVDAGCLAALNSRAFVPKRQTPMSVPKPIFTPALTAWRKLASCAVMICCALATNSGG